MTRDRMIELLEIEHKCMLRGAHGDCDRNCADCELVQDDGELHEMYTNVIELVKKQEPVRPISASKVSWLYKCECGNYFTHKAKFCERCGRPVIWE